MASHPRLGPDVLFLFVGPLALLTPLTRFLRDKGYPLVSPEVGLIFVGFALLGLVASLLIAYGGTRLRLLTTASLMTIYVDVQFQCLPRYYHWFLALAGIGLICWVLRANLGRILLTIFSVLWLSSLMTPPKSLWTIEGNVTDRVYDKTLPPLVHIILDEHIGIEGIPKSVDPHGRTSRWLRKQYVGQGYRVFSRAYSRYRDTYLSLPALFNFANTDSPRQFVTKGTDTNYRLKKNVLFERLKARGYKIHVLESSSLAFSPRTPKQLVDKRYLYDYSSLKAIHQSSLRFLEKSYFILGSYKYFCGRYIRYYNIVAEKLHLPRLPNLPYTMISPITSMAAAKQAASMLKAAKPGNFYLMHLLLPHYPYAYHDNCTVRQNGAAWLFGYIDMKDDRANSPASRHERYRQYLEQMQCAHKTVAAILGELENSVQQDQTHVVIHGDHGSRIAQWMPSPQNSDHLLPTDYIDIFSTFVVARTPTLRGGYDRHPYALEEIMAAVYFDESLPPTTSTAPPEVYLFSEEEVIKKNMPPFANGEHAKSW